MKLGALFLGTLLVFSCALPHPPPAPRAKSGVLDLRAWNFDQDGPVALSGEWDFFPGQFLDSAQGASALSPGHRTVPDKWYTTEAGQDRGKGAATYRLKVLVPPNTKDLGIWYKPASTSMELESGGEVLARAGKPGLGAGTSVANYQTGVCALPDPVDGQVVLLVRISNYVYKTGGMWEAFLLGPQGPLSDGKYRADILTFLVFGFIASMAVYSLTIFLLRRRLFLYLSFGVFVLAVAFRTLVTGEYVFLELFPGFPFDLLIRLEYLSVYLILGLGILYLSHLFPREIPSLKMKISMAISGGFGIITFVLPLDVLTSFALVNYLYSVGTILVFSIDITRAILNRRSDAKTMGLGVLIVGLGAVLDIFKNSFFFGSSDILPFALVIFTTTQTVILARRFIGGLRTAERLSREKEELERLTEERKTLAVLKERELLAHELHDSVGQKLGFLNMGAQTLKALLHQGRYDEVDAGLQKLSLVATQTHGDIREFLLDIRSTQILSKGFGVSLADYLASFQEETSIAVTLTTEGNFSEEAWTSTQKIQAYKIIQEALSNVRKHAHTSQATIRFSPTDQGIRLEVEDAGVGFAVEKGVPRGHFGMEIMKERAAQAHGSLEVISKPGAGTRVVVQFHSGTGAEAPPLLRASDTKRPHQVDLLVVDDHELFRTGLCNLLTESGGYHVVGIAATGPQALEKALELKPHVVLMDVQIPGMDGIQTARTLRKKAPQVKIIILTAFPQPVLLHESLQAGVAAFLAKSVQPEELFSTIDRVVAGEVLLTPAAMDEMAKETIHEEKQWKSDPSLAELTGRQLEVLRWASAGLTYKEIGAKLFISERTVKYHMAELVEKLHVKDRRQAEKLLRQ